MNTGGRGTVSLGGRTDESWRTLDTKLRTALQTAALVVEESESVGGRRETARGRERKGGVAFTERMNGRGAEGNNTCFAERT